MAYKLQDTNLIELERGKVLGITVRNFEESSSERTVTYLHLRANHVNSRPLSIYFPNSPLSPFIQLPITEKPSTQLSLHFRYCILRLNTEAIFDLAVGGNPSRHPNLK